MGETCSTRRGAVKYIHSRAGKLKKRDFIRKNKKETKCEDVYSVGSSHGL